MNRYVPMILLAWLPLLLKAQDIYPGLLPAGTLIHKNSIATRYINSGDSMAATNPSLSLYYYRKAADESMLNGSAPNYAIACRRISSYWLRNGNSDSALFYAKEGNAAVAHSSNNATVLDAYEWLLHVQSFVGMPRAVVSTYRNLPIVTLASAPAVAAAKIENQVGNAYADLGYRDSAAYHYRSVTVLLDQTNQSHLEMLAAAYNGLATLAIESSLFDEGFRQLSKVLELQRKMDNPDPKLQVVCFSNFSLAHLQQGLYDSAVYYGKQGLAMAEKNSIDYFIPGIAFNIASAYILAGKPQEALPYSTKAYEAAERTHSPDNLITAAYSLSLNLLKLKRYKEALPYAEQAMKLSKEVGRNADISNSYHYLAEIHAGLGQPDKAYYYMHAYAAIQDSLRGTKSVVALSEVESRFKLIEKEKSLADQELLAAQQEISIRKKNTWLIVAIISVLSLIGYLLTRRKVNRQKQTLHRQEIAALEQRQEIDLLHAKMKGEEEERNRLARELHDGIVVLFSAIKMNLSVLPEKHNTLEDAPDFRKILMRLDAATAELRKTAHNLMPDTLLESGLAEALFYFCKGMEQGSSVTIDYQQFVEIPRLRPEAELSVYRIIQELLQNIFKHAKARNVILQISHDDNLLNITIEDDGSGIDFTKPQNSKGMGLKNTQQRVKALSGLMDINASAGKGTSIYLEFDTHNLIIK